MHDPLHLVVTCLGMAHYYCKASGEKFRVPSYMKCKVGRGSWG
jgi:hypothetical protein